MTGPGPIPSEAVDAEARRVLECCPATDQYLREIEVWLEAYEAAGADG